MTTTYLTDVRNKVIVDLSNVALGTRWSNTELDAAAARALREFSDAFPYRVSTEIAVSAGVRSYDLSTAGAGALSFRGPAIVQVECPYDVTTLPERNFCTWRVFDNTLYVDTDTAPTAGQKIRVFWNNIHTLSESVRTYNPDDEDMLVILAAAYALVARAASAVNAVNVGGGGTPANFINEASFRRSIWNEFVSRRRAG